MKRCFILSFVYMLASSVGVAQKAFIYNSQQKNGFVSVSVGASLPSGLFGKVTNCQPGDGSGKALMGRSLSLSGGYRLAGPLGLMARLETVTYPVDITALAVQYPNLLSEPLPTSTGQAGRWQSHSLLLGPYITVPLGRIELDLRALAGQAWATCPETLVQGTRHQQSVSYWSGSESSATIGSNLGLTLRYRLTPVFGLHVAADYSTASFQFNAIKETRLADTRTASVDHARYTLSAATISGGLIIQFRSKNRVL